MSAALDAVLDSAHIDGHTRGELRRLVKGCGLDAELWPTIAELMLWHLGRVASLPLKPHSRRLGATFAGREALRLVPRRAYQLVDANRHRLPPVDLNREGPAWE